MTTTTHQVQVQAQGGPGRRSYRAACLTCTWSETSGKAREAESWAAVHRVNPGHRRGQPDQPVSPEPVSLTISTASNSHLLNLLEDLARQSGRAEGSGQPDHSIQRRINMIRAELFNRLEK